GKPRTLHVAESLASINFNDFEPGLISSEFSEQGNGRVRPLVRDRLFSVDLHEFDEGKMLTLAAAKMQIVPVLTGPWTVEAGQGNVSLGPGQFCLLPASLQEGVMWASRTTSFLCVEA